MLVNSLIIVQCPRCYSDDLLVFITSFDGSTRGSGNAKCLRCQYTGFYGAEGSKDYDYSLVSGGSNTPNG